MQTARAAGKRAPGAACVKCAAGTPVTGVYNEPRPISIGDILRKVGVLEDSGLSPRCECVGWPMLGERVLLLGQ